VRLLDSATLRSNHHKNVKTEGEVSAGSESPLVMTTTIRELEPKNIWNYFSDLNAVPRPSKKEERVIEFMMNFGRELGLPTSKDEVGNVLITKPATPGKENSPTIALQSHLDMVHQKNSATQFDFQSEGIRMQVEDDWVKAEGTTLGADNGIGVACAMAVLASDSLEHPALEALFTIDEETGMTGAKGLKGGLMSARYLLNLDTEEDTELCIGCAGGVDVVGTGSYETTTVAEGSVVVELALTGLSGGHSGMDIHRGRANANKLMNRFLERAAATCQARILKIDGGGLRNAIPRESHAKVVVPGAKVEDLKELVFSTLETLGKEYATTDPSLSLVATPEGDYDGPAATHEATLGFVRALHSLPNGIYRLSPDVEGLVQTSSNLARVVFQDASFKVACLVRGSVDSEKCDMGRAISCALEQIGAEVTSSGEYPGWAPKPDSEVVKVMTKIYRELFDEAPHVLACHAGLECGIIGQNYPDMEMISFGPNIRGAHSPDETVQVSSVQKTWKLLVETLARI
jgi:dipeptidase D